MVIVAFSDIHLGYSNSNVDEFDAFLQALIGRKDVDTLVMLGDCVDMWRRDVSGLFLENNRIVQSLLTLQKKTTIHFVAGNHDYHLLELVDHKYPFEFEKDLTLPRNGCVYVFKHGYEFDFEQRELFMELLCYNLSDESGQLRSDIWTLVTSRGQTLDYIKDLIELHTTKEKYLEHLLTPPKDRLSTPSCTNTFSTVEQKAAHSVQSGQLLVFGHTHRPFVSPTQNLVNTGSWVNDEETHNTYVELDGGTYA